MGKYKQDSQMHECKTDFSAHNTTGKENHFSLHTSHLSLFSFFFSKEQMLFAALFTAWGLLSPAMW